MIGETCDLRGCFHWEVYILYIIFLVVAIENMYFCKKYPQALGLRAGRGGNRGLLTLHIHHGAGEEGNVALAIDEHVYKGAV